MFVYLITCFLLLLVTCFFFLLVVFSFLSFLFPSYLLTYLVTSVLSFPSIIGLLHFQAGCCKRRLNLGYNLSRFSLCYSVFLFDDLCFVDLVVIYFCVSLDMLYCYNFSPGFNFDFLSTRQEIGWEECLRCHLFSVEWDVKP